MLYFLKKISLSKINFSQPFHFSPLNKKTNPSSATAARVAKWLKKIAAIKCLFTALTITSLSALIARENRFVIFIYKKVGKIFAKSISNAGKFIVRQNYAIKFC